MRKNNRLGVLWNNSETLSPCTLAKTAFLFTLIGLHSEQSWGETQANPSLICRGLKCPRGHSLFCFKNKTPRCIPCREGTFSASYSRSRACRPCSRCHDNEFELSPCTQTSNVICKECSLCRRGFQMVRPCERRRDTVCREKCRSPVEFGDVFSIRCKKEYITEELEHVKQNQKKENPRGSIRVEVKDPPRRTNGTRKPEQQNKPSAGFRGVQPTPPSPYSSSPYSHAAIRSAITNSLDTFSHSVVASVGSGLEPGESVEPSVTVKVSAEFSRTVERKTGGVKPQGDRPKIPRHIKRNAEQNRTKNAMVSVDSPKPEPSEGSITKHGEIPFFRPDISGIRKESTTTPISNTAGGTGNPDVGIPEERSDKQRSIFGSHIFIYSIAGAVLCVLLLVALLVLFRAFKKRNTPQGSRGCWSGCRSAITPRAPRCPGSSHCCEGNSVSSVPEACAVDHENDGNPEIDVTSINETEDLPTSNQATVTTYLSTIPVKADVHRPVFDVFPPEGETGQEGASSYPQFITYAENLFTNNGGMLSHPDSNVVIKIENSTISEGTPQKIFFGVFNDDTKLLRDIPETCERTLISPMIQCGPEDISLSKPVEIVLPHCLYVDEVKKASIRVFRCGQFSENGPLKWEKVPLASEKTCQSKSWFTVKKDTIHIKTKTFSLWSVFACGGPKRKRATVFAHKPNPDSDVIFLRFYIYSDNEDSKKRVERIEKERFPLSKPATNEKPFKMYNDSKDITVWLDSKALTKNGWELDQTPDTQTYKYEMAYKNGYRSYESCAFSVKPSLSSVDGFSCSLYFQQEEYLEPDFLYVNPGITPLARKSMDRFSVNGSNEINSVTKGQTSSEDQSAASSPDPHVIDTGIPEDLLERGDELVTQDQFLSISIYVGPEWKNVLRHLGMDEAVIKNLDEDHKFDKVNEKCYQGLLEWKNCIGCQEATMRRLCDALHKAGCSKALETLSKTDVGQRLAPIPESTTGLGTSTCV